MRHALVPLLSLLTHRVEQAAATLEDEHVDVRGPAVPAGRNAQGAQVYAARGGEQTAGGEAIRAGDSCTSTSQSYPPLQHACELGDVVKPQLGWYARVKSGRVVYADFDGAAVGGCLRRHTELELHRGEDFSLPVGERHACRAMGEREDRPLRRDVPVL